MRTLILIATINIMISTAFGAVVAFGVHFLVLVQAT